MANERQLVELEAAVHKVSLMEDRARVMRRGSATLRAGRSTLRIDGVAPVLADKTLSVRANNKAARIVDVRVKREWQSRDSEAQSEPMEELRQLEEVARSIEHELGERERELKRLTARSSGLKRIHEQTLRELAGDVAYGRVVSPEWKGSLEELRLKMIECSDELVVLSEALEERRSELSGVRGKIMALHQPVRRERALLEIDLECSAAGEVGLDIDYVVPGACWRPYHVATLGDEGLTFRTDACVWQASGEDWVEVDLVFSTERVSLGVEPPTLSSDYLFSQRKSSAVYVEARDQEVESVQAPRGGAASKPSVPGIDDGGEVVALASKSPATILSDGRPHRVFVGEFECEVELELFALPELNPCVLLKSCQENTGPSPILAGPVDLIRDSGVVGRTRVLFVASKERFELGWGPCAELRLKRHSESGAETSRALSSWSQTELRTEIRLSNLGNETQTLRVVERVPVSEIDKVKIEVDSKRTTESKTPDDNGFVEWRVELGPRDHKCLELCYRMKKHDDVQS